jgi:hypothetical protein
MLNVLSSRLENQCLTRATFRKPEDAVAWFGAMQAQDYLGSLWAIGLRTRGASEAAIEDAERRRAIVRTWPMRGTLHFVAADDARWITRLLAPRIIARNSARWKRDFGVDEKLVARADEVVTRALEGGKRFCREDLYATLEAKRIRTDASRGLHLLLVLSLKSRLCLAGRLGKQHSFALLDEWIPKSRLLEGEEAFSELARRYFTSHGPATQKDFMWWAGLTVRQAGVALANAGDKLSSAEIDGTRHWWGESAAAPRRSSLPQVRLLPAFDEYTVGYEDRSSLVEPGSQVSKMGLLNAAVLVNGRVVGTWKRTLGKQGAEIRTSLARKLTRAESAGLRSAVQAYGEFLGVPARLTL